jgi:hypothetical protein
MRNRLCGGLRPERRTSRRRGSKLPGNHVGHHVPKTNQARQNENEHPHILPKMTLTESGLLSHVFADPLPEMLSATRLLCEYTLFCDAMALPEVRSVSHSVLIGAARLAPAPVQYAQWCADLKVQSIRVGVRRAATGW